MKTDKHIYSLVLPAGLYRQVAARCKGKVAIAVLIRHLLTLWLNRQEV
jgi:hypothetical protein